jgi:hypothetical protein
MVDRSEELRLAVEARDAFGVVSDRICQNLDRNVPAEPRIAVDGEG